MHRPVKVAHSSFIEGVAHDWKYGLRPLLPCGPDHGQTLSKRTITGPSFQLLGLHPHRWVQAHHRNSVTYTWKLGPLAFALPGQTKSLNVWQWLLFLLGKLRLWSEILDKGGKLDVRTNPHLISPQLSSQRYQTAGRVLSLASFFTFVQNLQVRSG